MADPLVISTEQTITVTPSATDSSIIINAAVTVGNGNAVNAIGGAGGWIFVNAAISGKNGIYDTSTSRDSYSIQVQDGATITALNNFGIALAGRATVINHGTIVGGEGGMSVAGGGSTLYNDGTIRGGLPISLYGERSTVFNSGTLVSRLYGIVMQGGNHTITNTGTIDSSKYGIAVIATSDGNRITNYGTIRGQDLAIFGGNLSEHVVNHGALIGGVNLNYGDDFLDNRGGTIVGTIDMSAGNDTCLSGDGDETLSDGTGNDSMDAGGGIDTLSYADFHGTTQPATVDLNITTVQATGWGDDILLNFENISGSDGADTLIGNEINNVLRGNGGGDILSGGSGNDTIEGGDGNDQIKGGDGIDTAIFSGTEIATLNLSMAAAQATGYGVDTLEGIENVTTGAAGDLVIGSAVANVLIGSGGADNLSGAGGNDTIDGGIDDDQLHGGGDHDQIFGRDGADALYGDTGDDLLNGGEGNDTLEGGAGVDTAVFSGAASDYVIVVSADGFATVTDKRPNADGIDVLKDIEHIQFVDQTVVVKAPVAPPAEVPPVAVPPVAVPPVVVPPVVVPLPILPLTLVGTRNADRLTGAATDDRITGLAGNDVLSGQGGNDMLLGGTGKDVLTGGSGQDIFVFDTKPNKATNLDRITDFSVADDTIHLAKSAFTKIAKKGVLAASAFYVGTAAHNASDRIIFNKKIGALFYDSDGNGGHAAIQIASLAKNLKMTYRDFFVI